MVIASAALLFRLFHTDSLYLRWIWRTRRYRIPQVENEWTIDKKAKTTP